MHRAKLRKSLHDCCSAARVGCPPFGSTLRQAAWAAWNRELLTPSCCGDGFGTAPPPPGSGKFGTPCERMQRETASAPLPCADDAGVPFEPSCATLLRGEPPHPAATRAAAAAAAMRMIGRKRRVD